jgi:hypothetical protein
VDRRGAHKLPSQILFAGGLIILSIFKPAVPEKTVQCVQIKCNWKNKGAGFTR